MSDSISNTELEAIESAWERARHRSDFQNDPVLRALVYAASKEINELCAAIREARRIAYDWHEWAEQVYTKDEDLVYFCRHCEALLDNHGKEYPHHISCEWEKDQHILIAWQSVDEPPG